MHFCIMYNAMEVPEQKNKKVILEKLNDKSQIMFNWFLTFGQWTSN